MSLHLLPDTPEPRRQTVAVGHWHGEGRQTEELCRICAYCGEPLSDFDRVRLERGARISHGAHPKCLVEAGFPDPGDDGPDGPDGGRVA